MEVAKVFKILNTIVIAASQSFQFFRQITWFLRSNRALSIFKYQYYPIMKKQSVKTNFILTTQATLTYIYMCVSLVVTLWAVCVFVCVCVWYQIRVTAKIMSSASNLAHTFLHRTCSKVLLVLRYQDCAGLDS